MQVKTQGIVLSISKYNDTFSIVHIFTRDFGRVPYMLPLKGGKKSKIKMSYFSPLSVLSLEVEHMPLREIQRIKDAQPLLHLFDLRNNITKISLSFFMSDFLSKILRETNDNELIFNYLKQSIEFLEELSDGLANFHLAFIFGLTRFLGIYPNLEDYLPGSVFDLMNGGFVSGVPIHKYYIPKKQAVYLTVFRRINYGNMHLFKMSKDDRSLIIDYMLNYYRLHLYNFSDIKSLDVLKSLS